MSGDRRMISRDAVGSVTALAAVSFTLNFAWEMVQMPLFSSMAGMSFGDALIVCTRAALGDVVLTVGAYLAVAVIACDVRWGHRPAIGQLLAFCLLGIAATIVLEIHAIRTARWTYAESMPRVPLLGVAWIPLLQWAVVPTLCIGAMRFLGRWRGKRRPS